MSQQNARELFTQLVNACREAENGQQMLAMYNHAVQFTLLDGGNFYFDAQDGQTAVQDGQMPEKPLTGGYEIKADTENLLAWFSGKERYSDLIEQGRMFPVASHTTKRHIDYWLAQIVRLGNGQKTLKEVY
jgi:hypothetical protein